MENLNNFYRNITFSDQYDEHSFIGYWLDYSIWSDDEYWKLDDALNAVKAKYPYPNDIPRDISAGIARIAELMMVPNWLDFEIKGTVSEESTIYARFERLKYMVRSVFSGETVPDDAFSYRKQSGK